MTQRDRGRRRAGWALLALLAAACPARSAGFSKSARGTTGAQFLELPASARAAALGSAQGAAVRDATALDYNPAALAAIEGGDAVFMHAEQFEGISYDSLAAARRFGDAGTLALGLRSLSPGKIEEIDNTGAATGGSLAPRDLALALGYGRAFGSLELGMAGKYLSSKIEKSASAFAVDLGARRRWGPLALSAGLANAGKGLKFRERSDPLPLTARFGSSYDWKNLLFALDLVAPRGTTPYPAAGAEYRHRISEHFVFSGRLGFDGRLSQSRLGGLAGIAFGGGLEAGRLRFDYAAAPYGDLGLTHRLSAGLSWGGAPGSKKAAARVAPARASAENTDLTRALATAEKLLSKGGYGQAETVLEEAYRAVAAEDSRRIPYHEARGRIARLRGDCEAAKSRYAAGLALASGPGIVASGVAGCYAGIGLCLLEERKPAEAADYLAKGLEADPPSETRRLIEERLVALRAGGDGPERR